MDFEKIIRKRASIKNYSDKKVDSDKIISALEAANLAPSPGNLSILRFIIVDDKEIIAKIAQACQQPFIKTAPVVVVVCSEQANAERMYDSRAEKYIRQHAGAAIENFLLKIIDMKLASCWVGAFSDVTLKNLLKIPDEINIEVVLPIAHKAKTSKEKQRQKPNLINVVYFNEWKNKYKEKIRKIGET